MILLGRIIRERVLIKLTSVFLLMRSKSRVVPIGRKDFREEERNSIRR